MHPGGIRGVGVRFLRAELYLTWRLADNKLSMDTNMAIRVMVSAYGEIRPAPPLSERLSPSA